VISSPLYSKSVEYLSGFFCTNPRVGISSNLFPKKKRVKMVLLNNLDEASSRVVFATLTGAALLFHDNFGPSFLPKQSEKGRMSNSKT